MADVKWIKLATNIFDNRKIRQIECLPDGDAIIVVWVKLLCLAGSINDSGFVYFTKEIPYTDQMLAAQFNRPLTTVQLAMNTFQQFGMIEIIDDMLHISNWEKYQSVDRLAEIREYNRLAKQKSRAKQKLLQGVNDSQMTSQSCHDTDIDIDKELDIDIEEDKEIEKKKNKKETTHTLFKRLLPDYILSDDLQDKMEEWIKYKTERKEPYKEQGMKSLLRQVENNYLTYGSAAVCDLIDQSMSSGWKGIIFDKLKQQNGNRPYYRKQTKAEELDASYNMMANWAESE